MDKISIIIPAYNEEKRIGKTLEAYGKFYQKLKNKKIIDIEILIVINNTKDKTEEIVRIYQKKYKIIKYLNLKQGGKGFAIIEGFRDALKRKNDFIGFVDADMATSPEAFYDLIKNIDGNYGIIASRYVSGAIVNPKQRFSRVLVSRIFNMIIKALFLLNYKDTQCGAKLFRRKAIERIINSLGMTQWAVDIDLLYNLKKENLSTIEFPTIWSDKAASTLNVKKASIQMFFAVVQLRVLNSPLKRTWKFFEPAVGIIWRIVK